MGANSKIEWTDHTFNPWIGCVKIAEGCKHCYAESLAKRTKLAEWGPNGTRVNTSESYWKQPAKWNRKAKESGERARVFCASMADVFEAREGLDDSRRKLFQLIDATPWLDWQLVTKRPENIRRMWPGGARKNVWLLTSISTQEDADHQIPELLKCLHLSPVLGLSVEPLLSPIKFPLIYCSSCGMDCFYWAGRSCCCDEDIRRFIDWVIVGGESGPGARPMHPDWVRSIRDDCQAAGVAFFFKQWGEWLPLAEWKAPFSAVNKYSGCVEQRSGGSEWFPMRRVGKKAAGRELDGRTWDEFPNTSEVKR